MRARQITTLARNWLIKLRFCEPALCALEKHESLHQEKWHYFKAFLEAGAKERIKVKDEIT